VLNNYQRHPFGASINWINIIDRCEAGASDLSFSSLSQLRALTGDDARCFEKIVSIKPAYASVNQADGLRILVDRLWPRGLQKADAHIDHRLRNLAPSTPLRK
jgi:hypothetical protein